MRPDPSRVISIHRIYRTQSFAICQGDSMVNGKPPRTSRTRISPASTLRTNSNSCAVSCFKSNSSDTSAGLLAQNGGRPRLKHQLPVQDSQRFKAAVAELPHGDDKLTFGRTQLIHRSGALATHGLHPPPVYIEGAPKCPDVRHALDVCNVRITTRESECSVPCTRNRM